MTFFQFQFNKGSHTDWTTWKMGESFLTREIQGILAYLESRGKLNKIMEKSGNFNIIFSLNSRQ